MMKAKKIKLEQLQIKSFVTKVEGSKVNTIHGGVDTRPQYCPTTTITVDTSDCIIMGETFDAFCIDN